MDSVEQKQRESVKAGALMLDQLVPGWHHYIKPEALRMASCSQCALGQLFGADVETSIAKAMYPELWRQLYNQDGFTTALWGHTKIGFNSGMLNAICESKGLDFQELRKSTSPGSAFGMDNKLHCMWAEETAERVAKDAEEKEIVCEPPPAT